MPSQDESLIELYNTLKRRVEKLEELETVNELKNAVVKDNNDRSVRNTERLNNQEKWDSALVAAVVLLFILLLLRT